MNGKTRIARTVWLSILFLLVGSANVGFCQDRVDYTTALHHAGYLRDDSISFIDFRIDEDIGYMLCFYGLYIIDYSDPQNPSELSFIPISQANYLELHEEYIYISGLYGLYIINISDPTNPMLIGDVEIVEYPANRVVKSGDFIYTEGVGGLRMLDISDPTAPTDVGNFLMAEGTSTPMAVDGNLVFAYSDEKLVVVDTSDPTANVVIGTYDFSGSTDLRRGERLIIEGDLAFIVNKALWDTEELIRVLDISDPTNIETAGSWTAPDNIGEIYRRNTSLAYANGYLYCRNIINGLYVIDVSNPQNPELAGHLPNEGQRSDLSNTSQISGDMLFNMVHGSLQLVSITTPSIIEDLGVINMGEYVYCLANAPLFSDVCLVGTESSFNIVDHSQPSNPVTRGTMNIAARDIYQKNGVAFLAAPSAGLFAVDITDQANPTVVGTLEIGAENITGQNQYVYVKGDSRLYIIDISIPEQMSVVGQCPYTLAPASNIAETHSSQEADRATSTHTGTIVVSGNTVLLGELDNSWYEETFWFNIDDPTNPYLIVSYSSGGIENYACGLSTDLQGNIAISSDAGNRSARDVSDPTVHAPYPVIRGGGNFTRSGDLLYMFNNSGGSAHLDFFPSLRLVDTRNPMILRIIGSAYIMETEMGYDDLTEGSIVVSGEHVVASWGNELFFAPRHSSDIVPVFLTTFDVQAKPGVVDISWRIQSTSNGEEFRLTGSKLSNSNDHTIDTVWEIPHVQEPGNRYMAHDIQDELTNGGNFEYSLYVKDDDGQWTMIDSRAVELSPPSSTCYLDQAHPNPFNPQTAVSFYVGSTQQVTVAVYDLAGRQVAILSDQIYNSGKHTEHWNGQDKNGRDVSSGTYMVQMKADDSFDSKKITLVR